MNRSKFFIIAVLAMLALAAAGCAQSASLGVNGLKGSQKLVTRDYAVQGFTGIDACCGFTVTVKGGDQFQVSVTTDDNIIDYIVAEKQGANLVLKFDNSKVTSFMTTRLEAAVTLPELDGVTLDGGARLTVGPTAPASKTLTLRASGGSQANLSSMAAQNADVNVSGGSSADVKVTGKLNYDLSGGSHLKYTGGATLGQQNTSGGASASSY